MSAFIGDVNAGGGGSPDDDIIAGEYALGVLDAGHRREVEARMRADVGLSERVAAWEARLSPLFARVDPVEPSVHIWPRIRTQLGLASVQGARPSLWNNVGFWRGATAVAIAAGVTAIVIGVRQPGLTRPPIPVAIQPAKSGEQAAKPVVVLARDNGTTAWLATVDPSRTSIFMVPVPTPLDATGRVDELWVISPGKAPKSLGFVSNEKAHTVAIPVESREALAVGASLAITLEPKEGMPHVAPSGPIVAKGKIATI